MPSNGCVFAKLMRSPNDKWRRTCDKLNDDDEYGCTSWMWMWFRENDLPGATWNEPPICESTQYLRLHITSDRTITTSSNLRAHNTYPIHFNVPVNLASFIQRQFLCFTLFVHIVLALALLELLWRWFPSLFAIRIDHVLAGVTAMRLILLSPIAVAARRPLQWRNGCHLQLYTYCICLPNQRSTHTRALYADGLGRIATLIQWSISDGLCKWLTFSNLFVDVAIFSFFASSMGLPLKSTRRL